MLISSEVGQSIPAYSQASLAAAPPNSTALTKSVSESSAGNASRDANSGGADRQPARAEELSRASKPDRTEPRPSDAAAESVVQAALAAPNADQAQDRADAQKRDQIMAALKETADIVSTGLGDADSASPAAKDVGKLPV